MNKRFPVGFEQLGLGFEKVKRERRGREEEEREMLQKNDKIRTFGLLCTIRIGSGQNRPIILHLWPLDASSVDPD